MLAVAASTTTSRAATGGIDTTYGDGGVVTVNFNDASAINRALFADARGYAFEVSKAPWDVSGTGPAPAPWAGDPHLAAQRDSAMDGSGRIVVVGSDSVNNDMRIVRWSNVGLDSTFGSSDLSSPGVELPRSPNGALIAAAADGSVMLASGDSLIKLTSAGQLDSTWNPAGVSPGILPFASVISIAFTPTGDLMVACADSSHPGPCLTRLLPDGSTDASFGTAGWAAALPAAGADDLHLGGVVVAADGSVYDAGSDLTTGRASTGHYDVNGQPVASFGVGGLLEDPLADTVTPYSYSYLVAAPNGGLYGAMSGGDRQFRIAKYTATGQRDPMVGSDGLIYLPTGPVAPDAWDGLAITPKGNLLAAAGTLSTAWVYRFATAAAPAPPVGVTATPGDSQVTLNWSAPSYIGSEPVTGYHIYRSTTSGERGSEIGWTATTAALDGHLINGTNYYYEVTAVNAAGEGLASQQVTATPQPRPGAPVDLLASPGNGVVVLSWAAPSSTSAIVAYRIYRSTTVGVHGALVGTTPAMTFSDTSVANGTTYYYAVAAVNASGEGGASGLSTIPYAPSTVTITGRPASLSRDTSPTFTFVASDPNALPTATQCGVDGPPLEVCSTGTFTTSASTGTHTFAVSVRDTAGPGSTATYTWTVDGAQPTATLTSPTQPFSLGRVTATWAGHDTGSGVASYDLRYRRAAFGSRLSSWRYPTSWRRTTSTALHWNESPGFTDCFSVRSRDRAGNTSVWTPPRCTAVPLDDRALVGSPGWTRATAASYYRSTIASATRSGEQLTRGSVVAGRLALIATRCADCGTVRVYFASKLVATVRLYAPTTHRRSVILLAHFALRTGSVSIRIVSVGKRVAIDGLGATPV